jgi:hypothetical protein
VVSAVPVRVVVRASGLSQSAWQAALVARLRALPGVEVAETHEPRPLLPADVFLDPHDSALTQPGTLQPRLGYWRFIFGTEGRLTDPATREHATGQRGVLIRLVSIASDGTATLLEGGVIKTVTHSLAATRARISEAIADWPARALRRILDHAFHEVRGPQVSYVQNAGPTAQSSSIAATVRGIARRIAQESVEEHWTLGVIRKPVHHVIDSFDANAIEWIEPPRGHALADPLGAVEHNGKLTVLAEGYDFEDRQGRIVACDIDVKGHANDKGGARLVGAPREVLRLPVHLSYPHLLFHGSHIYCLPEASATGKVQLFRADPFPDKWVPDRILLQSFAGADATIHAHAGRWWMFLGNHADQDETKLYVFHATELLGSWQPHALNPVKCDLRSARSAGPLFEHDGELYRPAQDGSAAYGGAVAVNRIVKLTPTAFEEETINVLRPSPTSAYPHGLHTLTGIGGLTIVDGKRHTRSLARLAWGLRHMARGS